MTSLPVLYFTSAVSLGALATLGVFAGAAVYDVRSIKKRRPMREKPHAKLFRQRPEVSVVVVASNQAAYVVDSLKSIGASDYRKYEIVVLDNASEDDTSSRVREFIATHSKKDIRLITKRKPASRKALERTAQKTARGELVMMIDAPTQLLAHTIRTTIEHFLLDPELIRLVGRRLIGAKPTLTNQARQLGNTVYACLNKAKSSFGLTPKDPAYVAFRRTPGRATQKTAFYASDVVVKAGTARFVKKNQKRYRVLGLLAWLLWVSLGFGMAYVWYLAVGLKIVQPLGILWFVTIFGGLLFVLNDTHQPAKHKVRSVSLLPAWYLFSCAFVLKRVLSPFAILGRLRLKVSLVSS